MERKDYEKFANQKGCYMLHDEDNGRHSYKIGWTHNIDKRFDNYNSGMDFLGFIPSDNITKDEWDKDVHRHLRNDYKMIQDKGHHTMNDKEWYVFPSGERDDKKFINLCNVISYALKNGTIPDYERTDTYAPRVYQKEAIDKCVRFFQNNPSEKYFLFAMKRRSGKSFTALMAAKELGAKNVLVLTYKPNDVKKEWRSLVNNHVAFKGINFEFCSFQDNRKFEECAKKLWDVVIVDEDHFGADKEKARNKVAGFNTRYIFLLTGTPAYQIMYSGFTKENSFNFSYVDEQEYVKSHDDLAALSLKMYAAHVEKVPGLEKYSCGMSEFLRVKDGGFVQIIRSLRWSRRAFSRMYISVGRPK